MSMDKATEGSNPVTTPRITLGILLMNDKKGTSSYQLVAKHSIPDKMKTYFLSNSLCC